MTLFPCFLFCFVFLMYVYHDVSIQESFQTEKNESKQDIHINVALTRSAFEGSPNKVSTSKKKKKSIILSRSSLVMIEIKRTRRSIITSIDSNSNDAILIYANLYTHTTTQTACKPERTIHLVGVGT